jgi:hypothetical protein
VSAPLRASLVCALCVVVVGTAVHQLVLYVVEERKRRAGVCACEVGYISVCGIVFKENKRKRVEAGDPHTTRR